MRISSRPRDTDLWRHFVREGNALEEVKGEGSLGRVYQARRLTGYRPLVAKMVPFGHTIPYENKPLTCVDLHYLPGEYLIINGREQSREWEIDKDILLRTINACKEVLIGKRLQRKTHAPFARHFADYPVLSDGRLYLMMVQTEAPGDCLEELMEETEIPGDEIGRILYDLSAGIDILREENIVHRDIKPGNIHFMPASYLVDERERPVYFPPETRILDFGIATLADDSPSRPKDDFRERFLALGRQIEKQLGYAVGTPSYMSPEQACGEAFSSSSDLYALGLIAVELLAGQSPHQFDDRDNTEMRLQKIAQRLAYRLEEIRDRAVELLHQQRRTEWVPAVEPLLSPLPEGRREGQEKLRKLAREMIARQPEVHRDLFC